MTEDDYAIDVANLSKEFQVHYRLYTSLKGHAAALAKGLLRRQPAAGETRRILDGITFRIKPGESVGIVGRNGSGKSTLLSIISRVYLPTSGEVRLKGRMISLLELGAGFNEELTGTENIFFNGAIIGLTQEQVAERYDRIVEFSELTPETLDLPVRMYSSGMRLRLGFAVATHMDAEILMIDEGLSVGDVGFQGKSLARIRQFKEEGKTMLTVSHDIVSLALIADRGIWLEKGHIMADGEINSVIKLYRESYLKPAPLPVE